MGGTSKLDLGDRMKEYERATTEQRVMRGVPFIARLDGKSFHTVTKNCERPFDGDFHSVMIAVTKALVEQTNAVIGYTQSDEITLVFKEAGDDVLLDGRLFKLQSILAGIASAAFRDNQHMTNDDITDQWRYAPVFDCRVFSVPDRQEAANCVLWREQDATKNSINSAAQKLFDHRELQGLDGKQLQEKMFAEKGINWNDYPVWAKRGTYVSRVEVERKFTTRELAELPPMHAARKNPNLLVRRSQVCEITLEPLLTYPDRAKVLFSKKSISATDSSEVKFDEA